MKLLSANNIRWIDFEIEMRAAFDVMSYVTKRLLGFPQTVADIGVFCGLSSGMFVCEPEGDSRTDFRADPDELARFVDDAVVFGRDNEPRLTSFLASVMRLDTSALVIGETSMGTGINFEF